MKTTFYYNEEAAKYAKLLHQGTHYLSFRDMDMLIAKHVPKPSFQHLKAVDYGCGAGRSTRYLKDLGIPDVEGFDVSEDMIRQAKEIDPRGDYQLIESANLPTAHATYDLALMSFVTVAIEDKRELSRVFQELHRVLKNGGILLSLTLSETFWNPKRQWISYAQDYPENYAPKSGQKSRLKLFPIDLELTDSYWTEKNTIASANEAHLSFVEIHHPLGKEDDGIAWKDEAHFGPYSIFVFKKNHP